MKYCKTCGKEMSDQAKFCVACGTQNDFGSTDPSKEIKKNKTRRSKRKTILFGVLILTLVLASTVGIISLT